MKQKTVFFGGTFNPFHIGHLKIVEAFNDLADVEKVYIMPDRIPPHKSSEFLVSDADRIEMCRLAAEDFEKAELSLIEFEREGKSYTYDTVVELKKRYPEKCFYMACGGDMIASLDRWYRWDELIKEIGFYAFRREGENGFFEAVERLRSLGAEIIVVDSFVPEVSSTEIRALIKQGVNTELLPPRILEYIKARELYL